MAQRRPRGEPILVCNCNNWPVFVRQKNLPEEGAWGEDKFRWNVTLVGKISALQWVESTARIFGECERCQTPFCLRLDPLTQLVKSDDGHIKEVPTERSRKTGRLSYAEWRNLHYFICNHPESVHVEPMPGLATKPRVRVLKVRPSAPVTQTIIRITRGEDGKPRSEERSYTIE